MSMQMSQMLNDTMTELVAKRFRALGEPMRLRILQALEDGEKPVGDIVDLLEASQPNISKHLKALCQEGLVNRRRKGLNVCYSIADPVVFQMCALICRSAVQQTRAQLAEWDAPSVTGNEKDRKSVLES
jgi:DNA-binding transcriptional ArsR family regulator